jgi:hypothetical protein
MSPDSRFKDSRSHTPETDSPLVGNTYVPFRRVGDLVFVSGQLPRVEIDGTVDVIGGKAGDTLEKHARPSMPQESAGCLFWQFLRTRSEV